ncbi:MAG: PilC/PilY family type IV pilus protein [Sterolibacteriaceae bacterium MAG5]|nr:PilC/PilY family type IV pilus protein [Candidatus Nitricoxidireducens bremensis]
MSIQRSIIPMVKAAGLVALAALAGVLNAATTDLATTPLITPSSSNVKPNLYFVLDDSGSMDWDYLPDWVNDSYCKTSTTGATSACYSNSRKLPVMTSPDVNRIYYNPEITYTPPSNYDGSSKTSYSSWSAVPKDGFNIQSTSTTNLTTGYPDIEWCTDGTYTDCLRADNYLLPGTVSGKSYTTQHATSATGTKNVVSGTVTAPTTSTRTLGPYYHLVISGEYCTTKKLTTCNPQTAPTSTYPYPAKIKWCTSVARDNCQALKNSTFSIPSYPTIIKTAGASSTGKYIINATPSSGTVSLSEFVVIDKNGVETDLFQGSALSWAVSGSNSTNRRNNLANAIVAKINLSSNTTGFSATSETGSSTGRFKITTPASADYDNTTSVRIDGDVVTGTTSGTATTVASSTTVYRSTAFSAGGTTDAVPGNWMRVDIVSGSTYGNIVVDGATIVDRANRTDCAARPTCTYAEEMTNFANWYAWYQTRMQMTKSSLSRAFSSIDDRFRVGFFSLNNNTGKNIINMKKFDATQKQAWYAELFASIPNSGTPLRAALSKAGRLYAGKTSAITGATDPVEYSCQKNFTILSTDGYWNGSGGVKIDGTTSIGNEDGSLPLPEKDGANQSNTLADVAAYYYNTDLRSSSLSNCTGALGASVCDDNVPTSTTDKKKTQHMVTYTVGLGIDGVMQYRSNYKDTASAADAPDDYEWVSGEKLANQDEGQCSWLSTGTACYWPIPGSDKQENMDDLWHAAVNGHGTFYSARSPTELYNGLNEALTAITATTGGAAAATTSNPNITTGDNFVFSSNYMTAEWTGELVSNTMDTTTGDISSTANWSAQAQVDSAAHGLRSIYTFDGTNPNGVKLFTWANLNAGTANTCSPPASERGCFSSTYIDSSLSQFCASGAACLSATQKTSAQGENLLNFLRGQRDYEQTATDPQNRWYRTRTHVLGDIVSAEAVYVGRYLFDYGTANGYPEKNTARSDPTVYAAANDGMLHAFNALSGAERWAFVPGMAMRNMFKLADVNYATKHIYLVDGTPTVADIQEGGGWKTILVGGLAGGGSGYYALDITDQASPKAKWEFRQMAGCTSGTTTRTTSSGGITQDCDLGYSYGNPVIGKLSSGTWVVILTSGYNNETGGKGEGYLYILDAATGAMISKASTGEGTTTTPSGLGRINGWSDNAMQDGTISAVYGGDLLGNMWKFDLSAGSTPTVSKLYSAGASKPITAKPELGKVVTTAGQTKRVVFFPTGRLLGTIDLSDNNTQSFYAIWDKTSGSPPTTLVKSVISSGGEGRIGTVTPTVFDDDANLGWYLDFPDAGERGNTDPTLAFGTLVFSTNKPSSSDACNPSGFDSWVYNIDYLSGGVVEQQGNLNTHVATKYLGASTRPTVVVLPSGVVKSITRTSGQAVTNNVEDVRIKSTAAAGRRVSWRELTN